MTAKFEWVKLFLTNWKTIVSIALAIISFLGLDNWNLSEEVVETRQQMVSVAEQYHEVYAPAVVPVQTQAVSCTNCAKEVADHVNEYHR